MSPKQLAINDLFKMPLHNPKNHTNITWIKKLLSFTVVITINNATSTLVYNFWVWNDRHSRFIEKLYFLFRLSRLLLAMHRLWQSVASIYSPCGRKDMLWCLSKLPT